MAHFAVHSTTLSVPPFFVLSEDDLQCNHSAALRQQMCDCDLGSAHAVLYCAALTDEQRLLLRSQAGPRWLPAWLALWVKRQIWKTDAGAVARCPDHRHSLRTPGPPHTAAIGGFKLHSHVLALPYFFFFLLNMRSFFPVIRNAGHLVNTGILINTFQRALSIKICVKAKPFLGMWSSTCGGGDLL